jgi:hypothetical protein
MLGIHQVQKLNILIIKQIARGNMQELSHQLNQIINLLSSFAQTQADGFCEPPTSLEYIFIDGRDINCWHMLDDGKAVQIQHKAIAGTIQQINRVTTTSGGEESEKLDMWLKTSSTTYVIRCGWESNACRSLLKALSIIEFCQLQSQIIFSPYRLQDRGVQLTKTTAATAVFFDVWTSAGKVMTEKSTSEISCEQMLSKIQYLLTGELPTNLRDELMKQSSLLIEELRWHTKYARSFVFKYYNVKTRQQLTVEQLQDFVNQLIELSEIQKQEALSAT